MTETPEPTVAPSDNQHLRSLAQANEGLRSVALDDVTRDRHVSRLIAELVAQHPVLRRVSSLLDRGQIGEWNRSSIEADRRDEGKPIGRHDVQLGVFLACSSVRPSQCHARRRCVDDSYHDPFHGAPLFSGSSSGSGR